MKKLLLFIILCISFHVNCQTLEEVNFSPTTSTPWNTYTTGINNKGFICGYYENATGNKKGYVVNPNGKTIIIDSPLFAHMSVEGINDSCLILVNATDASGNITILKGYYDSLHSKFNLLPVAGNGQPNVAKPYGLNNNNVYTGWYPNLTERWLFTLNDSTISSTLSWDADKYYNGSAWDPTYVLGINDNDLLCGYVIDGGINTPMVYNATSSSFDILPFANQMKIHDINNTNKICGQYRQASGIWCGFYADYSAGAISGFHSINSLFNVSTMQSVINGTNDSAAYVGSYLHPGSGKWIGFIYRPALNEYRLPGFAYATDTWSMPNNNVNNATDVFTPNYYGSFNYSTVDPFAYNGFPLLNNTIQTMYAVTTLPSNSSVSWKGFAKEAVAAQLMSVSSIPYYENNLKPLLYNNYSNNYIASSFNGYCFGFSYATLLRKYRQDKLNQWYNIALNTNISTVANTDTNSVLAIERMFLKQYDPAWSSKMFPITTSYWSGMYRMKYEFMQDSLHTNPQSVGLGLNPSGGHNVLPYKIRTPKKFPFDTPTPEYDTMYVYDSSNPNDSTQLFLVLDPLVHAQGQGASNGSWPNMYELRFQKIGIRDAVVSPFSTLKKDRNALDTIFNFAIKRNLFFNIKNTALNVMKYDGSGFSNTCTDIKPEASEELNNTVPKHYTADTVSTFVMNSSDYADSVMQWNINKNYLCMGISRKALPAEHDYSTFTHRTMTYGNPDNVLKKLNCYFIQLKTDGAQAATILVNDLEMNQNDSILTENPSDYIYKITKISGGITTYNLTTYTFNNDTAKQFNANNIPLGGNTSHIIDGFYGVHQNQTVIFVDNGLNGNFDDTLFVTEVPVGILNSPLPYELDFNVYPIPVSNKLNIIGTRIPADNYSIVVCTIDGRILLNEHHADQKGDIHLGINTSSLAKGNYLLFVRNGNGDVVSRRKFTKE